MRTTRAQRFLSVRESINASSWLDDIRQTIRTILSLEMNMLGARHVEEGQQQPHGSPLLTLDGKLPMSPSPLTRTVKAIWKQSGNASSSF